jgi:tRNA G18 (ribose-2'-O)-methylase SpoU
VTRNEFETSILALSLKTDSELIKENKIIVEGYTLVKRLFDSDLIVLGVISTNTAYDRFKSLVPHSIPLLVKDTKEISDFLGYPFHRGIIAIAERPKRLGWDHLEKSFEKTLDRKRVESKKPEINNTSLFAVCTEVQEGTNLGAIIRYARAFDIDGIILGPKSADPWTRKAIRASAGQVFFQKLIYLSEMKRKNKHNNYQVFPYEEFSTLAEKHSIILSRLDLNNSASPITKINDPKSRALVLGHEFDGLADPWIDYCQESYYIPMPGEIDSLNVSVAAGIAFFTLQNIKT